MKRSLFASLASYAVGKTVYDLDDTTQLDDLESNGLEFEGKGSEENLKIASSNGATGFSWLIDREDCRGVVDITNGYVFTPPESDDGFDVGFGEEIFTLTAEEPGECVFRIAYANPSQFISFEDYANQNGLIIQIPIQVGEEDVEDTVVCDPETEDC